MKIHDFRYIDYFSGGQIDMNTPNVYCISSIICFKGTSLCAGCSITGRRIAWFTSPTTTTPTTWGFSTSCDSPTLFHFSRWVSSPRPAYRRQLCAREKLSVSTTAGSQTESSRWTWPGLQWTCRRCRRRQRDGKVGWRCRSLLDTRRMDFSASSMSSPQTPSPWPATAPSWWSGTQRLFTHRGLRWTIWQEQRNTKTPTSASFWPLCEVTTKYF